MASARNTRRWTATEAERVLEAWRGSGQSMSAFARGRGFDVQRLAWWRKRLAEWGSAAERRVDFAPAVVSAGGSPRVSVHLDDGIRIEVAEVEAVPPAWLAAHSRAKSLDSPSEMSIMAVASLRRARNSPMRYTSLPGPVSARP